LWGQSSVSGAMRKPLVPIGTANFPKSILTRVLPKTDLFETRRAIGPLGLSLRSAGRTIGSSISSSPPGECSNG
jgi:hypothetical protein